MRIENEFVLREIAGDYVIVPIGENALNFNGLITVNELGAFLWEKLKQDTTKEALVEAVLEEYEVDEETAKQDIEEFLEELVKHHIL